MPPLVEFTNVALTCNQYRQRTQDVSWVIGPLQLKERRDCIPPLKRYSNFSDCSLIAPLIDDSAVIQRAWTIFGCEVIAGAPVAEFASSDAPAALLGSALASSPPPSALLYVDGELDTETRAAVDAAIAMQADVAQRVARQQAVRVSLQRAFAEVLTEPVPQHLLSAARAAPANVHAARGADFPGARAARAKSQHRASPARLFRLQWGTIAASLFVGLILGKFFLNTGDVAPFVTHGGQLLARGALAQALSEQLASNQLQTAAVQIGVSFRARGGEYCRTFAMSDTPNAAGTLAGLACHAGRSWQIEVLTPGEARAPGAYRMAGSDAPKAVLQALEARIAGEPLDAGAEAAAHQRGWQP